MCIRDRSRQHAWPGRGQSHQNWIEVTGVRLIQVVLPLFGTDATLVGYLEGISRLDEQTLQKQGEQVRNGCLLYTSVVAITILVMHFTGFLARHNLEWLVLVLAAAVFPAVIFL